MRLLRCDQTDWNGGDAVAADDGGVPVGGLAAPDYIHHSDVEFTVMARVVRDLVHKGL